MGSRESSGGRCRQREARSTGTRARMNTATGLKLLGLRGSLGRGILRNQAQKRIPGSARCLSAFRAMSKAADVVFETLEKEGSCLPCMDTLHTREQTYAVIDYHKHEQMLDKFQAE